MLQGPGLGTAQTGGRADLRWDGMGEMRCRCVRPGLLAARAARFGGPGPCPSRARVLLGVWTLVFSGRQRTRWQPGEVGVRWVKLGFPKSKPLGPGDAVAAAAFAYSFFLSRSGRGSTTSEGWIGRAIYLKEEQTPPPQCWSWGCKCGGAREQRPPTAGSQRQASESDWVIQPSSEPGFPTPRTPMAALCARPRRIRPMTPFPRT